MVTVYTWGRTKCRRRPPEPKREPEGRSGDSRAGPVLSISHPTQALSIIRRAAVSHTPLGREEIIDALFEALLFLKLVWRGCFASIFHVFDTTHAELHWA